MTEDKINEIENVLNNLLVELDSIKRSNDFQDQRLNNSIRLTETAISIVLSC